MSVTFYWWIYYILCSSGSLVHPPNSKAVYGKQIPSCCYVFHLIPRFTMYPPKFGKNRLNIKWQKKALEIIMADSYYHEYPYQTETHT